VPATSTADSFPAASIIVARKTYRYISDMLQENSRATPPFIFACRKETPSLATRFACGANQQE